MNHREYFVELNFILFYIKFYIIEMIQNDLM